MHEDQDRVDFYGVLGRTTFEGDTAVLRFYPFAMLPPGEKKIFVVRFEGAGFTAQDVAPTNGQELEVTLHTDRAEVVDNYRGDALCTLRARSVSSAWHAYDLEDYERLVRGQSEHISSLQGELRHARRKSDEAVKLLTEMIRRTEALKVAASEDLRTKHGATVVALERVLRLLESKE